MTDELLKILTKAVWKKKLGTKEVPNTEEQCEHNRQIEYYAELKREWNDANELLTGQERIKYMQVCTDHMRLFRRKCERINQSSNKSTLEHSVYRPSRFQLLALLAQPQRFNKSTGTVFTREANC